MLLHLFYLFNAEILRASSLAQNQGFMDHERLEHGSPLRLPGHGHHANGGPMEVEGWSGMQTEVVLFSLFLFFDTALVDCLYPIFRTLQIEVTQC